MKKTAKTFQDLIVWQKAHAFVLTYQSRRAVVSLVANITKEFKKKGIGEVNKLLYSNRKSILKSNS